MHTKKSTRPLGSSSTTKHSVQKQWKGPLQDLCTSLRYVYLPFFKRHSSRIVALPCTPSLAGRQRWGVLGCVLASAG